MILRYAYSLNEQAVQALIAADDAERQELLQLFNLLCREPRSQGNDCVTDDTGRTNEIVYTDLFRVVYWPDHAVKEIRIIDIRLY